MKLLGRDFSGEELMGEISRRLKARGLAGAESSHLAFEGLEDRVDPLGFNLEALTENADCTQALPLSTHRGGLGRAVLLAKWVFRRSCQVLINETLARQRVFNVQVRDSYAQLSSEVVRLRAQVEELKGATAAAVAPHSAPASKSKSEKGKKR